MEHIPVLLRQADLLLNKGLSDEAAEYYIQVIGIDPQHLDAYARLGHAYCHQGRIKEAAAAYIKVLTFDEVDAPTCCRIAEFIGSGNSLKTDDEMAHNKLVSLFTEKMLHHTVSCRAAAGTLVVAWDFRSQPYSIGDAVLLQQVANSICLAYGIPNIRTCLLADKLHPARQSFLALGINGDNYLDHIIKLLPVFLLSQETPSLSIEHDEQAVLEAMAARDAIAWPPVLLLKSMLDLNLLSFKLLNMLYEQKKMLPEFTIRRSLSDWASGFIQEHAGDLIPIAVQIRKTQSYNVTRNTNMEAWSDFFRYCETRLPVKFFIICAASEVDDRLRSRENVVIAKDSRTSIDQDLALVKECSAFMGISSGPGTVAFFGNKPYSFVNAHLEETLLPLLKKEPWGYSFIYAKRNQRLIASGTETFDLLVRELQILIEDLDWVKRGSGDESCRKNASELRLD